MTTSYYCKNTPEEMRSLLGDANRSTNIDEIMNLCHQLETRALALKMQGGDVKVLGRIADRVQALSSQLVAR